MGKEGIALEHHVRVPLVGWCQSHGLAANIDFASRGIFKAGDHAQGSGLATATGTEQGKELSIADLYGHMVHGHHFGVRLSTRAGEVLGDLPHLHGETIFHRPSLQRLKLS
jgi:hypothetical protein